MQVAYMTRMTEPDCAVMCNLMNTHTHNTPWEDQGEWHRMTRMTGPDCAVMCNLINTHTHTHTHTHTNTKMIDTFNRHRVSPKICGSRNCGRLRSLPESTCTGPVFLKAVPVTSAAFSGFAMDQFLMRLSVSTPTVGAIPARLEEKLFCAEAQNLIQGDSVRCMP